MLSKQYTKQILMNFTVFALLLLLQILYGDHGLEDTPCVSFSVDVGKQPNRPYKLQSSEFTILLNETKIAVKCLAFCELHKIDENLCLLEVFQKSIKMLYEAQVRQNFGNTFFVNL